PQQPQPVVSHIAFVPEPGGYDGNLEVQLDVTSSAAVDIHFTNDGSEPDASSATYQGPIKLVETTLFRAAAFVGSERAGEIVSATYLVGPRPALPVLSISMNPADFDDVHLQSAATGRGSERPAFLELFDAAGQRAVATGFGLRLHGGAGRRGGLQTKKSYRTYFRKVYGDGRVAHPVIPEAGVEDFDKLVLRASSNDRAPHGSSIRDQVIRDLHTDMGALAAGGSWYVLLINAASRGVYNVTERMDEEFFSSHLGPGEYDVMKTGDTVLSGSREGWDDLRRFVRDTDFSVDANFEKLAQRVDVEDFTSYIIVNLCLQNYDWPHNNWYAARRVPDGKWIFLCWDSEWGLGYRHPGVPDAPFGPEVDPYAFMDSGGAYGRGLIRSVFLAMIDNAGYRDYYQQEVRRHLKGALTTDNIMRQVNRHRDAIAADIDAEYQARGYDKDRWNQQIAEVEQFARQCTAYFQKYTDAYFSYRSPPGGDNRVAMIEGSDGRRHVIYRTPQGRLHQLSSSADGMAWSDEALRIPDTAPAAAGRPTVYSLTPGILRVLYRGTTGHIHELVMSVEDAVDGLWRHTNLTSLLEQPVARCDPSVVVVEGVPHIVYVDQTSRAREFWFDGEWRQHPLPVAPRPAGGVVVSSTPAALHVTYRTIFGVPCEQTVSREAMSLGQRNWSHRLFHRLPAQGQPLGFSVAGKRRIVFRAAEQWPLREPFVFRWHARRQPGYRKYEGPRNTLVQAWNTGQRSHRLQSIGEPQHSVAGNSCLVHDAHRDQYYFAFRDANGHIHEATPNDGSWKVIDSTALAGAPPAVSEPAGIVSTETGSRYYVYLADDGHLHELYFDGAWNQRDLHVLQSSDSK
ncbi:MAG: CotH kinase family protein, partial [Planctomycetaceae bacterium]